MKDAEITNMFKMEKKAHLRKLKEALKVLQHPNKGDYIYRVYIYSGWVFPIKNE